jgi:glycosyltransferase involved in cell wall biosynthesis
MNKHPILVSVLVANYNNASYLEEAVYSVLNQSYPNWEIIIVDDASTDKSWDLINSLARHYQQIRVHQNHTNQQVGATKAKATELAKGEICAILDPDDSLEPTALERHVIHYEQHPECSMIGSNYYTCDENLNIIEKNKSIFQPQNHISYLASKDGGLHHFWSFRKARYKQTLGFDAFFTLAEDQDLFYKLEEVGLIEVIDEPLYFYRTHKDAISQGEKVSLAYAYHIFAQLNALERRVHNEQEVLRVKHSFIEFLDWGFPKIRKDLRVKILKRVAQKYPQALLTKKGLSAVYHLLR